MSESNTPFRADLFSGLQSIVTGGGSGIGATIARRLSALGANVWVLDKNGDAAAKVAEEIQRKSGKAASQQVDVTNVSQVTSAIEAAAETGTIDQIVNAAGIVVAGELADMPWSLWETSFAVNLHGALHVSRAAYPYLKTSRSASMVNIASLAAFHPYPGGSGYGPSKAALVSMSKQLAVEWGADGIRVNVISPGTIDTPMNRTNLSSSSRALRAAKTVLGRLGKPEDIADAACFLLSPAAAYVTGHELVVDGGLGSSVLDGPNAWTVKHRPHVLAGFNRTDDTSSD